MCYGEPKSYILIKITLGILSVFIMFISIIFLQYFYSKPIANFFLKDEEIDKLKEELKSKNARYDDIVEILGNSSAVKIYQSTKANWKHHSNGKLYYCINDDIKIKIKGQWYDGVVYRSKEDDKIYVREKQDFYSSFTKINTNESN